MANHKTHDCGGTIAVNSTGEVELRHLYCDRCGAFIYLTAGDRVPDGTDREANRAAWDAGDDRSPAAALVEPECLSPSAAAQYHRVGARLFN